MNGAGRSVSLDPTWAEKALAQSLQWTPQGCATATRRQIWVHSTDGGMYLHASRVAYAASHDWVTPTGKLERTCTTPQCVSPHHLRIVTSETAGDDVEPVDLDQVAYLRSHGWSWRLIAETTGWSAADVAAIPHVRRIHETLKHDATEYLRTMKK